MSWVLQCIRERWLELVLFALLVIGLIVVNIKIFSYTKLKLYPLIPYILGFAISVSLLIVFKKYNLLLHMINVTLFIAVIIILFCYAFSYTIEWIYSNTGVTSISIPFVLGFIALDNNIYGTNSRKDYNSIQSWL